MYTFQFILGYMLLLLKYINFSFSNIVVAYLVF